FKSVVAFASWIFHECCQEKRHDRQGLPDRHLLSHCSVERCTGLQKSRRFCIPDAIVALPQKWHLLSSWS
ncbi:hypothetical protein NAI83_10310, partial [Oxalobacter formigenes]|uniref:hypothetical protein n=1 Tax=Oxalobacter formigenes TaxID=847 RepID=UPI0022B07B27